ncbi:SufE family protein [Halopseudomonas salina]|uniref:Cysteine desulfurase, sulfur acceptor subunit CsdE n=1 Tax=Halopseudomonas salina TaxID=1323744 RepID=A0ABQ1PTA6_9GAMM|nr:SufE family protein [Halopseudomonas salina]GGD03288.1 cysteine desulfurase, sulfur acceptor subunit CsdE [Halopseudomonas salina]
MSQFGTEVTSDDIIDTLSFFDTWEERYKYIIDLGRELPALEDAQRSDDHIVRGCQSQVWLVGHERDGRLYFDADSDAFIVKGLLAVVLAAYNGKTPQEILAFDIEQYFAELNLLKHLSMTRGNGLKAMVKRIQQSAEASL